MIAGLQVGAQKPSRGKWLFGRCLWKGVGVVAVVAYSAPSAIFEVVGRIIGDRGDGCVRRGRIVGVVRMERVVPGKPRCGRVSPLGVVSSTPPFVPPLLAFIPLHHSNTGDEGCQLDLGWFLEEPRGALFIALRDLFWAFQS